MARVLIVDDKTSLRIRLRRILEERGHEVREAGDGSGALAQLGQWLPDLVVTDADMARTDGVELLTRMRSHPATAGILVILTHASLGMAAGAPFPGPGDTKAIADTVDAMIRARSPGPAGAAHDWVYCWETADLALHLGLAAADEDHTVCRHCGQTARQADLGHLGCQRSRVFGAPRANTGVRRGRCRRNSGI